MWPFWCSSLRTNQIKTHIPKVQSLGWFQHGSTNLLVWTQDYCGFPCWHMFILKCCPQFSCFLNLFSFSFQRSQPIKFIKFTNATFIMNKCKDNHNPTLMLNNRTNIISHYVGPQTDPHGSAWTTRCLKMLTKDSLMLVTSFLICRKWLAHGSVALVLKVCRFYLSLFLIRPLHMIGM
jgi:hypothetical protein